MKTRFILKKDFAQISNLWIKGLNNDIFSILGKKVVLSYLNNFFINNSNSLGFVIEKNKKIIAFLLYGNNERIIKQILDQNLIFIFLQSIKIFLSLNLNKIKIFINVLFFYIISKFTNNLDEIRTELLYICVDKNKFRKGMGSKIVKDSFVIKKNFFKLNKIKVKTLEKIPKNIKFYKKQNFKVKKKLMGRVFLTT